MSLLPTNLYGIRNARNNEFSEVILIALLPDAALLAERLRTLIGAKKELV
jgi:hypothetical protein